MPGPTQEQKESIKFFQPSARRGRLFDSVKKWRGDHRACGGHRSGECIAGGAWKIMHQTWAIVPDLAVVNIEENALGTVKREGVKGAYAEPIWKAKGWIEPEDAEGIVPSDEVKRRLVERIVDDLRINLEHKKAEYETVVRECKKLREAAEAANGLSAKGKKSDG